MCFTRSTLILPIECNRLPRNEQGRATMSTREILDEVLADMPEPRLGELLHYAQYLRWADSQEQEERDDWLRFSAQQLARAYGPDEPDYSEVDVQRKHILDSWQP